MHHHWVTSTRNHYYICIKIIICYDATMLPLLRIMIVRMCVYVRVFVCLFRWCIVVVAAVAFLSSCWMLDLVLCIVAKIERLLKDGYMMWIFSRSTAVCYELYNRLAHSNVWEVYVHFLGWSYIVIFCDFWVESRLFQLFWQKQI